MAVTDLTVLRKNNASDSMPENKVPTNFIQLDIKRENILKSTANGTAAVVVGYNKTKPYLDAASVISWTRGIGTEKDNVNFDPSLLLNSKTDEHARVPSHTISSCVDLKLRSMGKNYIASNRSAVMSNADIIQHRGNEAIELVVGNSAYRTSGDRIASIGGVYLIQAGREKNLQPMVLGNNLVKTLLEMTDLINNLSTRLIEVRKDIIFMKTALLVHTHIATGPGAPVTPSPDLAITLGTSFINDGKEVANNISNTLNFELFKYNHLLPFSPQRVVSDNHKLT